MDRRGEFNRLKVTSNCSYRHNYRLVIGYRGILKIIPLYFLRYLAIAKELLGAFLSILKSEMVLDFTFCI